MISKSERSYVKKNQKRLGLKKRTCSVFALSILTVMGSRIIHLETPASTGDEKKNEILDIVKQVKQIELIDSKPLMYQRLESNQIKYPEITGLFYKQIQTIEKPDDLMVLVNKNEQLPKDYEPSNLTLPNIRTYTGSKNTTIYLREDIASSVEKMFEDALSEGVHLIAKSGYRSYQTQAGLYQRYVSNQGVYYADLISAKPGHSEHQTGLAIDIVSNENNQRMDTSFAKTTEGEWLQQNAHKYGFILRYPEGRESQTGYTFEPWHFRYVGPEVAEFLNKYNLIFEEYLLIYQH